eukprot:UN34042
MKPMPISKRDPTKSKNNGFSGTFVNSKKTAECVKSLQDFESRMPRLDGYFPYMVRGLQNAKRVHCYVNSVIQALVATPAFRFYFNKLPHSLAKTIGPNTKAMKQFVDGFVPKKDMTKVSIKGSWGTSLIEETIMASYERYAGVGQQDVADFLGYLLNCLHEELVYTTNTDSKNSFDSKIQNNDSNSWNEVGKKGS